MEGGGLIADWSPDALEDLQQPLFEQASFTCERVISGRKAGCIFCAAGDPALNTVLISGKRFYVRVDNFPASDGHVEIVPYRHVESFFDLDDRDIREVRCLAREVRQLLDRKYRPDAFTIGINDGQAAGRTIHHLHIHIIPRWFGDVVKPEGGIRNIFPAFDPSGWLA